jgi:hypothetical protein
MAPWCHVPLLGRLDALHPGAPRSDRGWAVVPFLNYFIIIILLLFLEAPWPMGAKLRKKCRDPELMAAPVSLPRLATNGSEERQTLPGKSTVAAK